MYCEGCGSKLQEGASFCGSCGQRVEEPNANVCKACGGELAEDDVFCANCGTPAKKPMVADNQPKTPSAQTSFSGQSNAGLIGWTTNHEDPEILKAARKSIKFAMGFSWIALLLFPIGFAAASFFFDDLPLTEGLVIGFGVGALIFFIGLWRIRDSKKPPWEGVVIEKFHKKRHEHQDDENMSTYTEYTTVIRTDWGKKKKIKERDSRNFMYSYLAVGDRVRYHPAFSSYEKYDKSKDRVIYCNICYTLNPISNDRCKKCNSLLFK